VGRCVFHGLAVATRDSYSTPVRQYVLFCDRFGFHPPFPASQYSLCAFAAVTAGRVQGRTVGRYVSAIRSYHVDVGLSVPTADAHTLFRVLRGIRRKGRNVPSPLRLPVMASHLVAVRSHLDLSVRCDLVFWSAAVLAFLGFLRCGEFSVCSTTDPDCVLRVKHVRFGPDAVFVTLPGSKTDPFRLGVTICVGRTDFPLCAWSALRALLALYPSTSDSPLFVPFVDGAPMSRAWFLRRFSGLLRLAGVDPAGYAGQSFRRGAATAARLRGVAERDIRAMGRWASDAALRYVCLPPPTLLAVSRIIAKP
jgi:hypothetical protein